jgi:hypothetical protein
MSGIRKLVGSEQQLVVRSLDSRQGAIFLKIMAKNAYNLCGIPNSISQPWLQMKSTMRIIDIVAYRCNSATIKSLIRSTNSFPNLESITMQQPTERKRLFTGVGWVELERMCYDDDKVCVKTNPKLKRISFKPGVYAAKSALEALKEFVETKPGIECMDVINHSSFEDNINMRHYDNYRSPAYGNMTEQCERLIMSAVNTLAKNRALAIKKIALAVDYANEPKGGIIAPSTSILLEKLFSTHCYVNVFDLKEGTALREADSIKRPLFNIIKYFGRTRNSRKKHQKKNTGDDAVDEVTILANVDEANVNKSTVLTDATILANIAYHKATYDGEK